MEMEEIKEELTKAVQIIAKVIGKMGAEMDKQAKRRKQFICIKGGKGKKEEKSND